MSLYDAFMFELSDQARARRRQARERFERVLVPQAVPWSRDVRCVDPLVIRGETYEVEPLFHGVKAGPVDASNVGVRHGRWGYRHTVLRRGQALQTWYRGRVGRVYFTTDVAIPVIYEDAPKHVWMSLTPAEMISQRRGVRFCQGRVVVAGLGMGWFLREVCARPQVTEVVVVERSRDLLDWYGTALCKAQPKVVDVVCADAYEVLDRWPAPAWRYAFDIWQAYGDARDDKAFQRLKDTRNVKAWGWGDVAVRE